MTETLNPAVALADFTANLNFSDVPQAVVERAKLNLLDAFGIGLASVNYDFARALAGALDELGNGGEFPIIGMQLRLAQRDAAHLNGTLIHGLDFDDTHSAAVVHTSASAAPTMLSAGLATAASGKDALTAFIINSECASRIGAAAGGGFHAKGFHPSGVIGAFACALGAGYLYRLKPEQLVNAQGIALSKASSSLQFLDDGAWTKRNHPGWASACGQTAAVMAKHAFTGPVRAYDGRFGLFAMYCQKDTPIDYAMICGELGERWETLNIAFKPYPACHLIHAFADAILAVKRQHHLQASDIAHITARVAADIIPLVCEPEKNKRRPRNAYDAQFSIYYMIASSFLRERFSLAELEEKALNDAETLALVDRISFTLDPESAYPEYYSGAVDVLTHDGRALFHRQQIHRGSSENPMQDAEIVEKFYANASRTLPETQVERLKDVILNLEGEANLMNLADALTLK